MMRILSYALGHFLFMNYKENWDWLTIPRQIDKQIDVFIERIGERESKRERKRERRDRERERERERARERVRERERERDQLENKSKICKSINIRKRKDGSAINVSMLPR